MGILQLKGSAWDSEDRHLVFLAVGTSLLHLLPTGRASECSGMVAFRLFAGFAGDPRSVLLGVPRESS